MGLWRLSSPPSLPEAGPPRPGSSGLCPAGLWAAKDRNSTPALGNLCQCLTSFIIIKKKIFLLSEWKFHISLCSPLSYHWTPLTKVCLCFPLSRYLYTQLTVCLSSASPGPFPQSCFPPTSSPVCTGALGFSSPVQGLAIPLLNFTGFLLADCCLFLHDYTETLFLPLHLCHVT